MVRYCRDNCLLAIASDITDAEKDALSERDFRFVKSETCQGRPISLYIYAEDGKWPRGVMGINNEEIEKVYHSSDDFRRDWLAVDLGSTFGMSLEDFKAMPKEWQDGALWALLHPYGAKPMGE